MAPFSIKSFEEKPYNTCINCIHIGKHCDGPNFLAMSIERWCEWCKLRKQYLKFKNAYIAEEADVAEVTVDRIMSGHAKDLRFTTIQAVTKVLVNGSWGQNPCAMASVSDLQTVYVENPDSQKKIEALQEQVRIKDQQIADLISALALLSKQGG